MYREKYDNEVVKKYIDQIRSGRLKAVYWGTGFWGTGFGYQELKKRGIMPGYYCDNRKELWGKEIIDGVHCYSYDKLREDSESVVCIVMVASYSMEEVLEQLTEMGIQHVLPYDVIFKCLEISKDYFTFLREDKIAVYTCVVGGYDNIKEPVICPPNYDYYLISDKKPEKDTVYQWLDIKDIVPERITDYTRMNRYCKINAHKIFPNYRKSIYVDGNIILKQDMSSFFIELLGTRIATTVHNQWDSIFDEAMSMTEQKRDIPEKIYTQINRYWNEGMPEKFGGAMCNILLREHNHPICKKIMEDWWNEIEKESCRDQLSFPYVIWKNEYTMKDVLFLADSFKSDLWQFEKQHNISRLNNV